VRAHGDNSTLALQVFDGRDGGADTGVIGDLLSVEGNVDITTDKDLLSLELVVGKIFDRFLGVKSNRGGGESAGGEGSRGGGGEGRGGGEGSKSNDGVDELHG